VGANKKDKTTLSKALLKILTEFFDMITSDKARLSAIEDRKVLILASDINHTSFHSRAFFGLFAHK